MGFHSPAPVTDSPFNPQTRFRLNDLIAMLTTGAEVEVHPIDEPFPEIDAAAVNALREWHEAALGELAGEVTTLGLDLNAAGWAAGQFYRACQFLVCREAPAERVSHDLRAPCPSPRGPAVDFSVDLVFRFLPDLYDRARRLAPADSLVAALAEWAKDWPLSSPGVPTESPPALETFAGYPALWRLYVDRVTERRADDRWRDPRVANQLRADLGAFPNLASPIAESLRRMAVLSSASPHIT